MADVARLAEVSVPTVSRVLSGTVRVSPDKRARVEAAIAEIGFHRSGAARALASGNSEVIAVVTGKTSTYGYAEAIRGVEEEARAAGYSVMITVAESGSEADARQAVAMALNQSIAGVVVLKFDAAGVAVLKHIPPGLPVVALAGARQRGVVQAVLEEARAGEELTNYLLELGHRTVHHVRVPASRREDGRTTGWRRALRNAGAPIPPMWEATWDPHTGRPIGRELAHCPDVTAVFCGNDEIAMGVIRGLEDEGARVPEDVSVVGFDDHPLAELWSPPLTTVNQDFARLGRRGFTLLMAQIEGTATTKYSSERAEVIIRASAAPPAGGRGSARRGRSGGRSGGAER